MGTTTINAQSFSKQKLSRERDCMDANRIEQWLQHHSTMHNRSQRALQTESVTQCSFVGHLVHKMNILSRNIKATTLTEIESEERG